MTLAQIIALWMVGSLAAMAYYQSYAIAQQMRVSLGGGVREYSA